jgi:PAS domain S-box-containing protein
MKKPPGWSGAELRRRAELRIAEGPAGVPEQPLEPRIIHELEVHKLELEIQNEELRTARQEAEASLERYTELFDFAPIGYVVLGAEGVITAVNLEAARMLGVARSSLAERRFALFVHEMHRTPFADFLKRVLTSRRESDESESMDLVMAGHEGGELEVRLTGSTTAGAEPRALVAIHDLAARKLAERERALRAESRHKDEFMAMLSHELRNPLTPIRSSVAVLERLRLDGDEGRRAIAVIDRQIDHLVHIVDDLLDVTRIARGKILLQQEHLELGDLVRRTMEDHRHDFEVRGVALAGTFSAAPLWVHADATRLIQVVGNLLGNALKFTPRGGHVDVELRREGDRCVLSVRDDGFGIEPRVREHVFEPFVQAPQSLDRPGGGLGLGLAMVKGLAELHGGTVYATSEGIGCGAEFVVRLPLTAPPAEIAPPAPAPEVARRRVLVIDDLVDAADSLRFLLELDGHDARAAYDGPTGIALAREFRPEIILCDIGLPDMDGYEVARLVRADEALKGMYLVALSGYARPDDLKDAFAAGFHHHLAKPPSDGALERVLATMPGFSSSG